MTSNDKTVTVGIDRDEWYPVYGITEPGGYYSAQVEIPESLARRYESTLKAFDEVQSELAAAWMGKADR